MAIDESYFPDAGFTAEKCDKNGDGFLILERSSITRRCCLRGRRMLGKYPHIHSLRAYSIFIICKIIAQTQYTRWM